MSYLFEEENKWYSSVSVGVSKTNNTNHIKVLILSVNRHFMTSTYFSWTTDFTNIGYSSPNFNCQCMETKPLQMFTLIYHLLYSFLNYKTWTDETSSCVHMTFTYFSWSTDFINIGRRSPNFHPEYIFAPWVEDIFICSHLFSRSNYFMNFWLGHNSPNFQLNISKT